LPGFVFLAPGANGLKVLPLHIFDYETSESDPINRSSIHPAKVHPTNIVKLALNRFIIAVFMMFRLHALSITGLANYSVSTECKMQMTCQYLETLINNYK
jgi:hypothetical protein